jgi:hypothetical protein
VVWEGGTARCPLPVIRRDWSIAPPSATIGSNQSIPVWLQRPAGQRLIAALS